MKNSDAAVLIVTIVAVALIAICFCWMGAALIMPPDPNAIYYGR